MSLYNKYRPQSLEEMMGNRDTLAALEATLSKPDIPHAFLMTGPSGTGKTTAARIVRRELGCGNLDYKEIDSADFRGVDTIRDIRHNSQLSPVEGKVRVWLLDECHQLTKDAQNALLKALEDPPSHCYFILATTDPDKLLPTIRTRCTEFSWSPLPRRRMERLLREVAHSEGKDLPEEVARQVATDAMGSARQALVVLEKIIDLPPKRMLKTAARQAERANQVIELCRALFKRAPWKTIATILNGLQKEDPEKTRRAIMGYCRTVVLNNDKLDPQAAFVMSVFKENVYDSGFDGLVGLCTEVYSEMPD